MNVKVEEPGENNVHNNAFFAEEKLLKTEMEAMRDCDPFTARHWIVRNARTVDLPCFRFTCLAQIVQKHSCLPQF